MICHSTTTGKYYRYGAEITAEEYAAAAAEIKAKAAWVDDICKGAAGIEDVPAEWREEIAQRVAEHQPQVDDDPELSAEEALAIIMGGAT